MNFLGEGYLFIAFFGWVLILGILIFIGLYLGRDLGLGAPLLEGWTRGEPVRDRVVSALKVSLALGLGVAVVKYLLDWLVFSPFVPATLSQWREVPLLLRLAIPFQQGIGDEISYRLFWMTVLVWIIHKLEKPGDNGVSARGIWLAILGVGLLSIAGPLLWGTDILVKLQYAAIILTGAIPFGWLYGKKGIESAIIAHFTSSILLVLLSLFQGIGPV